jgi:hypothetical protein
MTQISKLRARIAFPALLGLMCLGSQVQAQSQYASPVRFLHDKSGYEVVARLKANGTMVLNGTHSDGRAFEVIVGRSGKVTGNYNNMPVDFKLREAVASDF